MAQEIELDVKGKILIPTVPNFISVDGTMQPLSYFSDASLTQIASHWEINLKRRAKEQRESYNKEQKRL